MSVLPRALNDLIEALGQLPGVGPRTAERYAYYLYKHPGSVSQTLSNTIQQLHDQINTCEFTFALTEAGQSVSPLYSGADRNKAQVMVVAEPLDIVAIEKIGNYKGTYHVLGGLISPIDGINPEELHIEELAKRVKADQVDEVILALNASVEGESTALYIQKKLKDAPLRITRLARGLPVGIDLEYADQITLGRALEGRTLL